MEWHFKQQCHLLNWHSSIIRKNTYIEPEVEEFSPSNIGHFSLNFWSANKIVTAAEKSFLPFSHFFAWILLLKRTVWLFLMSQKANPDGIRLQGSGNDFSAQVKCSSWKPDFSKNSFPFPLTDISFPSYDLLSMLERAFRSVDLSTGENCLETFSH